jgi:hypothetical protein
MSCSARSLQPLLDLVQTKLPIELREQVYQSLFDRDIPRVVPKSRSARNDQDYMEVREIFPDGYVFDQKIMGVATVREIQETLLRTTPIYLREDTYYSSLRQLLNTKLSRGRYVRDFIRYLRVYLDFDQFTSDRKRSVSSRVVPLKSLFSTAQLEAALYEVKSICTDCI